MSNCLLETNINNVAKLPVTYLGLEHIHFVFILNL